MDKLFNKRKLFNTWKNYLTKETNDCIQCKKLNKLCDVRILILNLKRQGIFTLRDNVTEKE